jgi:hypothetical protein
MTSYHEAHEAYISAVAAALTASGIEALDWYADPNDPRDGAVKTEPVGSWVDHDEVWIGWQEERAWAVLTIDKRTDSRYVYDLDVCTVASPETVTNAVIAMAGLDGAAPTDNFSDEDFPGHEFDVDDPEFEAALAAYQEATR